MTIFEAMMIALQSNLVLIGVFTTVLIIVNQRKK